MEGFDSILVVVDCLSKHAHFIRLKHPFSTLEVATIFARKVVKLHGLSHSTVFDRDKVFLSNFWTELFKLQGIELKQNLTYHPQIDGQTEVVNMVLETYLRCFVSVKPKQWYKFLHWVKYSYNTSYHVSAQFTSFRILYGLDLPPLLRFE